MILAGILIRHTHAIEIDIRTDRRGCPRLQSSNRQNAGARAKVKHLADGPAAAHIIQRQQASERRAMMARSKRRAGLDQHGNLSR